MKHSTDVLIVGGGIIGCAIAYFLRKKAGLRPKTSTSHPLLGSIPSWENATVASGHGGFGIMLSAITGEAIATLIATGITPQVISPFAPNAS